MALMEVKYVGLSDSRTIDKKNWEQEGVSVPSDIVWDHSNRHTVLIDGTERMEEVLRAQGHFRISKIEDDGSRTAVIEASDPYREADIIVDGDTGQRSANLAASKGKQDGPVETTVPEGGSAATSSGRTGKGRSTSGDS
jgi:hypothetical protein